ncbi:MAG: hypothetical protein ABFS16_16785 [Bacteroidota bacterium]
MKEIREKQDSVFGLQNMRNLTIYYALSLVVAILMAAASVAGLLYQETLYPTDELVRAFLPNDVVVLLIGLPILLVSMWLTWRGRLIGLLFWPGALFFVLYNYIIYLFAMPFNVEYLLDLALVTLSLFSLIGLLTCINGGLVRQRLTDAVPERLSGGILAGLGSLFFVRSISTMVNAHISQITITGTELALLSTDFLVAPAWIVGGILLWQRKQFGYVSGLGLLFQASMLFVGLIIVLVLQPFMTGAPFPLIDVIVVFVMGFICFVPFLLFIRGVVSGKSPKPL